MRILQVGLAVLTLIALAGCLPAPTPAAPAPEATTPLPVATATAAGPATSAPEPTPSPMPTRSPGVVGPLAVEGSPIESLVVPAGSPLSYALLADGLARSDDGGQTWRRVSDLDLPRLLVSAHDPRTLYAGDIAPCYRGGPDPEFYRSRDGGESWQMLPGGRAIRPVAEHPLRPGTLYGTSCAGFHISHDGGETWENSGPTLGYDVTAVLPLGEEPLRFLAVLTSEGGASRLVWFDESGGLSQDNVGGLEFWALGALAQGGGSLYLAEATGVWRSDDGGEQWTQFKDGLADVVLEQSPLEVGMSEEDSARGYGLWSLAVDPTRPERLAVGSMRGVYVSDDRGEHWRPVGADTLGQLRVQEVIWSTAEPDTLYAVTTEGAYILRLASP